jgi:hypothetical protein
MILFIWVSFLVLLIPISFTYFTYKYYRKYLWCVPIIALVLTGLMFLASVSGIHEGSLIRNIKYYFTQDWSIAFYFLYVPIVIVSLMSTVVFYLFGWLNKHK